jgi:hypothetical protein
MTLEDILKTDLPRLSEDVVGGPDLDRALDTGRRRRRRQVATTTAAAVGVVAVTTAVFAVAAAQQPDPSAPGLTPAGAPPAQAPQHAPRQDAAPGPASEPVDYVSGSQVDEQLQAAVAGRLPAGLTATDVYPTDWTRNTPLPDAKAENATDWELYYSTAGDDTMRIVIGMKVPYEHNDVGCSREAGLQCSERTLADGSTMSTSTFNTGSAAYLVAVLNRPDGKTVSVSDIAPGSSLQDTPAWTLTTSELERIATIDGLDFPDPVVTPPAHR